MKKTLLSFLLSTGIVWALPVYSQNSAYQPSLPRLAIPEAENNDQLAQPIEPKNVPDFPRISAVSGVAENNKPTRNGKGLGTGLLPGAEVTHTKGTTLQGEAASTTLPVKTRMKLILETRVDAKESQPGDIFEAHVRDDLFVGTNLLLPRGSLIRGRIAAVNKPRIISRAGRIGLKLDQIVTPTGEVIPLDAALEFQKGVANEKGQLDPGTSFGTRVGSEIKAVSGVDSHGAAKGALVAANVATLGVPTIATAIGGSAIALFRSGDNVNLGPGQEIEIVLTDNLGLQIN
jgi:hypothetical protein